MVLDGRCGSVPGRAPLTQRRRGDDPGETPPQFLDLAALEARAHERLGDEVYDYYAGGAETETTLREATGAWRRWRLRPRVLRGVSAVRLGTSLLGTEVGTPIGVAPWAYQAMAHPDGERGTARGAAAAGALMTVSTSATTALADVAAVVPAAATPVWTLDDIGRFGELSGLPVVVKGVLRGDDARLCAQAGAAAVWVSAHGGLQVDPPIASADALPEVVDAVGDDVEVYADGGIRSGSDALVALALGAHAVFVGRPVSWGLATGGADGVAGVLAGLAGELAHTMALCGLPDAAAVPRDTVVTTAS